MLKRVRKSFYLFILLYLFRAVPGFSQTDTLKLTLPETEKAFLQANLSLLAQKYHVNASNALIQQAKAWDNPVLSTDQNLYDGTHKFFNHSNGGGEVFLQLSQVFATAGKRGKLIQLAKDDAGIQQAEFNDLMRNLRYNLQLDFAELSTLLQQEQVYRLEIASASRLVQASQKGYESGNTSLKDLVRLKALLFSIENDRLENSRQINTLESELKTLLHSSETSFLLPVFDTAQPQPAQLKIPDLINAAIASRPDYASGKYQVQNAEHYLALQKALAVPDLTVGVAYDKNASYTPNYWGLQIGLPLPLLNRNRGNIKAARFEMQSKQASLQESELRLRNEVVSAVRQYELAAVVLSKSRNEFSRQYDSLFKGLLKAYQEKQIGLVEFVDFFESYRDTRLRLLQQQYNYQKAVADLNFTTGTTVANF